MSTKKQRKLDKKRKAKQRQNLANRRQESLAYTGGKYKTEELVPVLFETEISILEAFVMSGRRISDRDVEAALTGLIRGIRSGRLSTLDEITGGNTPDDEDVDDLVRGMVRRRWHDFFEYHPYPGRDNLVGILRTILGSIAVWTTPHRVSRGYLLYIEEFLGKAGVVVETFAAEDTTEPELELETDGVPAEKGRFATAVRRLLRFS